MATADTLAAQADAAFAEAQTLANNALVSMDAALAAAQAEAAGIRNPNIEGSLRPDDVTMVPATVPNIPTADLSSSVQQAFDYAFGSFNEQLQPQVMNYLTAFFPDIAAQLKTDSDTWLINTIADGRYVPIAVETALWNRAKDKEVQESLRMEQEVIDAHASRGFSLPPGVLNFTVAANQQELNKRLTTINREIAIKAFDTANENTKFAIQQTVILRTAFVAALGDFIKQAMTQPNNAVEYAKTILAAKTGLYDTAVRLYAAQTDSARSVAAVAQENNSLTIRSEDVQRTAYYQTHGLSVDIAKVQADTAVAAADQLGRVAAAAMATRNSVVSVSAGV